MRRKKNIIAIIGMVALTVFTYAAFWGISNQELDYKNYQMYSKHYVMIADNSDEELWNSVYYYALEEAKKNDAYIEMMGVNPYAEYSMLDDLEISSAAHVDGIIICPDGSEEVREKMKEISEQGIPIVTIIQDEPESGRIGYVGVNSFEMGELYETLVKSYMSDEVLSLQILRGSQREDSIITEQIKSALNASFQNQIKIETTILEKGDSFEAEETIRDIFLNHEQKTDVLICLNGMDSECAEQAAVDYNMVGDIHIIGTYTSKQVLSAIKKGIIDATISIDTKELGKVSAKALEDYQNTGYTSDYVSADLSIVNMKNIGQYSGEAGTVNEE